MKGLNKKNIWIHIIACFIILFMGCYHLAQLNYITVLEDEYGYWGTAASIVGYDWSELMGKVAYYAPGYSFLLVPIIVMLPNWMWYKVAILLNVLFLILTYFISIQVGSRLFPKVDIKVIAAAGALTAVYPGNITYATVAWSETLQYFLIWALTYLLVVLEEKFTYFKMSVAVVLGIYLYFVHNRNIGVLAILAVFVLLIMLENKRRMWEYLVPVLFLTLGYFAFYVFKQYEITWFYGSSEASSVNNFAVSGNMVLGYFQRLSDNLTAYGRSVYCKLFYLLLGTGFTFFMAVLQTVKLIKRNIIEKAYFNEYIISRLWCIILVVTMLLLTALQMMGDARKDIIVYARYFEYTIGPILFLGILAALTMVGRELRKVMIFTVAFCSIGIIIIPAEITKAKKYFNSICAPVLGAYYDNTGSVQEAFNWILFTMNIMAVLLIAMSFLKNKKLKVITIEMLFLLVFILEGFKSSVFMDKCRTAREAMTEPIYDCVSSRKERDLYYVDNELDPNCVEPMYQQYLIPDYRIHLIKREDLLDWTKESRLILVYKKDEATNAMLHSVVANELLCDTDSLILYEISR